MTPALHSGASASPFCQEAVPGLAASSFFSSSLRGNKRTRPLSFSDATGAFASSLASCEAAEAKRACLVPNGTSAETTPRAPLPAASSPVLSFAPAGAAGAAAPCASLSSSSSSSSSSAPRGSFFHAPSASAAASSPAPLPFAPWTVPAPTSSLPPVQEGGGRGAWAAIPRSGSPPFSAYGLAAAAAQAEEEDMADEESCMGPPLLQSRPRCSGGGKAAAELLRAYDFGFM
ncbi:zinc finger, C3HC4 type (RING finger) domain-containing protein [Besnoitia besnoiti]|uniref:Zinc finger, C3HC4 type (RING finger) domain-containing protein n=1 Tax=Besnoitia besnoiti TaxID=94643 RepID=A0A2A9MMN7_BESBE|nr:zinc finger, C3HC4 type (RING finger) domain-containing protein [Besnoitia besnoiti]PFH37711.1 zinc finger, C3HC4 type (RING finger) domain-containing protein [Besnoitia besnoiti]